MAYYKPYLHSRVDLIFDTNSYSDTKSKYGCELTDAMLDDMGELVSICINSICYKSKTNQCLRYRACLTHDTILKLNRENFDKYAEKFNLF